MTAKTQERFAVVCDGLWLNDTKPSDWNQQFPWKPSVSFYYYRLDQNWQAVGDVQKCWIKGEKNLWLFQAMGAKNAKGRYYEVEAESGVMKQEGKADKPYTTITPLGEVFRDGTARMLHPPQENQVSTPAAGKPPAPPPGAVAPPPGAKPTQQASVPPKTAPPAGTPPAGAKSADQPPVEKKQAQPRPKPSEKFMNACFIPESSQFWLMKDGFDADGYVLHQAHELAVSVAMNRVGWRNQKTFLKMQEDPKGDVPIGIGDIPVAPLAFEGDEAFKEEYEKWFSYFEWNLSETRWRKVGQRLEALLANCTNAEQVASLVDRTWAMLPLHHYDPLRSRARDVLMALKEGPPTWLGTMTATPAVWDGKTDTILPPLETKAPPVETKAPSAETLKTPVVDPKVVEHTVSAFEKYTEWPKLLGCWKDTAQVYREDKVVLEGMQRAILNLFMKAATQADVDDVLHNPKLRIPPALSTPEFIILLERRYSELPSF